MSTKLVSEFEFQLSTPIKYHKDGRETECTSLTLKAPSNLHRNQVLKIKAEIHKAIKAHTDNESKEEIVQAVESSKSEGSDNNVNPREQGILALTMVGMYGYNLEIIHDAFEKMLINGVCLMDAGVKLTKYHYDNMSTAETHDLLAEYIGNFILSS